MSPTLMIFGTASCPCTSKAREACGNHAVFVDVRADPKKLDQMPISQAAVDRCPFISPRSSL